MAITSTFSFTNTTPSANTVAPIEIDPVTIYAKTADEPQSCELKNTTCVLGQGEVLTYVCTPIKKVDTVQPILNPAKIESGIQYQIRLDEILRTQDSDGTVISDDPIVMYLNVRHNNSSYITAATIEMLFKRLIGAAMKDDGSFRFKDLMLSALAPTAN